MGIPHRGLREGIRHLLASLFDSVAVVASGGDLIAAADRAHPRLAVITLAIGSGDGLGLLQRLRGRYPDMRVIVLSFEGSSEMKRAVLEAGADRVVLASAAASELLPAVEALGEGGGASIEGRE